MKPKVLVIVPAYNEALNLPRVMADLRQCAPEWDVVVIDDGSRDSTGQVARDLGAIVLQLPFNLGIGGAVQSGLIYGARNGYDVCVQVDGDGQHGAGDTVRLVEILLREGADAVVGSRFLDARGSGGFRSTFARRIGIYVLRMVINFLTRQRITDPTSGQRAYGRRAIERLAHDYPQEYPEPEVIYLLARCGMRVVEVPVTMHARQAGRSSIGVVDSLLYMVQVLVAIFIHQSRPVVRGRT